jgi:hypothetical protein
MTLDPALVAGVGKEGLDGRLRPAEPLAEYFDRWKCQWTHYTQAQKRAIRLFLEHVRDAMPSVRLGDLAQKALDVYWNQAVV